MNYYGTSIWAPTDSLAHFGIKGMKWGIRRWQNSDGSFNAAGKQRYFGNGSGEDYKKLAEKRSNMRAARKEYSKAYNKAYSKNYQIYSLSKAKRDRKQQQWDDAAEKAEKYRLAKKEYKDANKEYKNSDEYKAARKEKIKKAAKIGATVAGTALVAYGAYKLNKIATDKLKAGDLYASRQHDLMAKMHLATMLEQQSIAYNYKKTLSDSSGWDAYNKLRTMENYSSEAGKRYLKEARAASELARRATSGKYSAKDKAEVIYKMIKRR